MRVTGVKKRGDTCRVDPNVTWGVLEERQKKKI